MFADLGSLAELDLSGNKLKDLPAGLFEGLSGLTDLDAGDNPGAPFTFTAELERRGDDTVVVRLAEGATPFDLKIELSARNGDLSAETVTIAAGGSYSDVVEVRAHGPHPVTVEIDSAAFLLPSGGSASGIRADRGSAMLMWVGRPLVQREWIQDGPFALHPENADPKSIWSDGETLWVGDNSARKVFAYKLWDNPDTAVSEYGTRDPGWDLPSLGEEDFYVTGHGPRLYVAEESLDGASRDVFGYDLTNFTRAQDRDFVYGDLNVAGGVWIVRGMATDGRSHVDHGHHVARARLPSGRRPGDAGRRIREAGHLPEADDPRQGPADRPLHRRADDVGRQVRLERLHGTERETVRRNRGGVRLSAPRGQRPRLRHLVERGDLLRRRRRRRHDLHLSWRQRRRSALRRRRGDRRRAGRQHDAARRSGPRPGLGRRQKGPGVHHREQQSRIRAGVRRDRVRRRFGPVVRAVRPRGDAQRGRRRRPGRRSLHADRPGEPVRAEREHLRRSGLGDDLPGSRERDDLLRGRRKGPRHRFRRHRRQWNGERLRSCRSCGGVVHRGRKRDIFSSGRRSGMGLRRVFIQDRGARLLHQQPGRRRGDGHGHGAGGADARSGSRRRVGRRRANRRDLLVPVVADRRRDRDEHRERLAHLHARRRGSGQADQGAGGVRRRPWQL